MITRIFKIGRFAFRVLSPETLLPPANFMLFESPESTPEYTYTIRTQTQSLPEAQEPDLIHREDLTILNRNGLETRYLSARGRKVFYGCYKELSGQEAEITLCMDQPELFALDTVYTSLFALERHMLSRHSLVLHCSFVLYQGRALLFSAPSGVGKSTQAGLWEKYMHTATVNGDRGLLAKEADDSWTAGGWPVCGSSNICENRTAPVGAIVLLSQGETNRIRPLRPMEAFSQLYSQITVNQWNPRAAKKAMDLLEALIAKIPVYHLSCTISEQAVRCLREALS